MQFRACYSAGIFRALRITLAVGMLYPGSFLSGQNPAPKPPRQPRKQAWSRLPQPTEIPGVPYQVSETYDVFEAKGDPKRLLIREGSRAYLVDLDRCFVQRVAGHLPKMADTFETDELRLEDVPGAKVLFSRLPNTPKFVRGMTWLGWKIHFQEDGQARNFTVWRFEQTDDIFHRCPAGTPMDSVRDPQVSKDRGTGPPEAPKPKEEK